MSSRIWNGTSGNFEDATRWSPIGVPQQGDTAIISAGTVNARSTDLSGVTIDIGSEQAAGSPDLALRDSVLGDLIVYAQQQTPYGPHRAHYADLSVSGRVVAVGSIGIGSTDPTGEGVPGKLQIHLSQKASFVLTGQALEQSSSSVMVSGGVYSSFVNDGSFTDIGGTAEFAVPVTGSGSFTVARGKFLQGRLTFESGVSKGEHITVQPNSILDLGSPSKFLGSVTEDPYGQVVLENTGFTSASYANGVLTVVDDNKVVASLRITSIDSMGFAVTKSGQDTIITSPGAIGSAALHLSQSTANIPAIAHGV